MKGFKNFLMQGNLVALAVAFVIGAAFATVIEAFTVMFMDVLGKVGGQPDFSGWVPGGVHVGAFLTALLAFLVTAFAIYFFVVRPYEKVRGGMGSATPEEQQVALLAEIRDSLKR